MASWKWSIIVSFAGLLLLGLPTEVKPDAQTEDGKTASAEECKVHIEKALEQYWDHKEPETSNSNLDQTEILNSPSNNDDEDDILQQNANANQNLEDDEDDDDDDDDDDGGGEDDDDSENEPEIKSETENKDNEKSEEQDTSDSEEDEDDDDEDEDDLDIPVSQTPETDYENEAADTTDDEEDDSQDDDISHANEDTNVEITEDDILSSKVTDDKNSISESTEEVDIVKESEEDDDDDDVNDDDDEDNDLDEQIEADDSTEEDEEDKEDESDEKDSIEETETLTSEMETESDQVTGDDDRASSGVVSELSEDQPSLEQPETSTISEEAFNVTETTEEKYQITDDDEDSLPSDSVPEDRDDDTIENIYEEDEEESSFPLTFRSRDHVDVILELDEIGTEYEKEEEKLAQSIFKEIKKIQLTNIKPIEMLYKYTDSTTRVLGDAEIYNKPMILFLGPWNSGKTTIINYLLGTERTPVALKTGTGITDVDFTIVTYGDQKQVVSGMELAADWRYSGVQKFGQGFLDHFRSIKIPSTLLKMVTIVDTPGIIENIKNTERSYSLNDAFQWFIDRADAIYVVLDPTKVDIGSELGSVLDQLKGRDVRFILNKADTIRRSDLMRVVGQLFWNLSPLMSSTEAPIIYAVSLSTRPYHPSAPGRFLADQENNFLYDLRDTLDKRVENRILYARRHAVRVRNHAKMVDCYLATYYRHKSIFSNKKNVAKLITENPRDYNIYEGLGSMTNVSRYDLPDPVTYKEFFKMHPLYDFKPLASTCSYFRGCPMDKLDSAIAQDIPELFAKYKKAKESSNPAKQQGR